MIFHEIYGSYYNAVAEILRRAMSEPMRSSWVKDVIDEKAFEESILTIPGKLTDGSWPLLENGKSVLKNEPRMPLTILQKRWLKALLNDPRVRLFDPPQEGLEDAVPLFDQDTFVYYDRYSDGDDYSDQSYIDHFRTILSSIKEKRKIEISFTGRFGKKHMWDCIPDRLEYSSKDDKFRLLSSYNGRPQSINLSRIDSCSLLDPFAPEEAEKVIFEKEELVAELLDERNALERFLLHFSHLEKKTERMEGRKYRITMKYEKDTETEMLIRILSFGPFVRVTSPDHFVGLIRERINKQF